MTDSIKKMTGKIRTLKSGEPEPQKLVATLPVTTPTEEEAAVDGMVHPMLSPDDRKRLLGRLAEFELQLLALNPNQQAFVMAYIMDPTDSARAARVAGYSERRAAATACDLLNRPAIAACIALGEQLREDRTMITSDRTLHELAIIAFSDITDFEFKNGRITTRPGVPTYATRAISSIEFTTTEWQDDEGESRTTTKTKIRLWPKDRALQMLAVYQKLLSGEPMIQNNVHVHNHAGAAPGYIKQAWKVGDHVLEF